jgi:uncharacterized protein YxeA
MKKLIVGILTLCIIGATFAAMHVLNPKADNTISQITSETTYKQINRSFTGFIFSPEGKLVKEVSVKISGKQYSETSVDKDNFIGTIEIDGEVVDISSTKNKAAAICDVDVQKFYRALNPAPDNINGVVENTTSVTISKDFNTAYGYTPNLKKNYGQGAFFKSNKELKTPQDENIQYIKEAAKRVNLYVAVMKAAFQVENGGNGFIAVKEETLEGLKDEKSKQDVLEALKSLSENVYLYEGVKDDKSLFEFDKNGRETRTLNGTLLSIKVEEFNNDEAVIEATSWFGNLGAVFPKYKAIYKNGQWQLEVISMAIP